MPQVLGAQNVGSPRRRGIATWRVLGVGQPGCGGLLAQGAEKSGTSRLRMHRTLGIQGAGHAGRGNPEAQGRMPEARSALVVRSRASWARGRTRAVLGTQSPGETARARADALVSGAGLLARPPLRLRSPGSWERRGAGAVSRPQPLLILRFVSPSPVRPENRDGMEASELIPATTRGAPLTTGFGRNRRGWEGVLARIFPN